MRHRQGPTRKLGWAEDAVDGIESLMHLLDAVERLVDDSSAWLRLWAVVPMGSSRVAISANAGHEVRADFELFGVASGANGTKEV